MLSTTTTTPGYGVNNAYGRRVFKLMQFTIHTFFAGLFRSNPTKTLQKMRNAVTIKAIYL